MPRILVKGMVATTVAAGVIASTAGVAMPAGVPHVQKDARRTVKAVAVFNQSQLVRQGLTSEAALHTAARYLPYALTTAHYVPRGFQMTIVIVYPFIPGVQPPADSETFQNVTARRTPSHIPGRPAEAPSFQIDHQAAKPYVYNAAAYFVISKAKLAGRTVSVAEQKYRDFRTRRTIDLLYVYWYDSHRKVATEVTSELVTSRLSRADVLRIASSVQ